MNNEQYQKEVTRTLTNYNDYDKTINMLTLGIGGEAGEIVDYIKKYLYHGHELCVDTLKAEIGDLLWYIANLCNTLNISISNVMDYNIEKLKKRYPNGFDKNDSINREKNNYILSTTFDDKCMNRDKVSKYPIGMVHHLYGDMWFIGSDELWNRIKDIYNGEVKDDN